MHACVHCFSPFACLSVYSYISIFAPYRALSCRAHIYCLKYTLLSNMLYLCPSGICHAIRSFRESVAHTRLTHACARRRGDGVVDYKACRAPAPSASASVPAERTAARLLAAGVCVAAGSVPLWQDDERCRRRAGAEPRVPTQFVRPSAAVDGSGNTQARLRLACPRRTSAHRITTLAAATVADL